MDYKEQIEQAKRAAVKWREKHPVIGVGEIRVDCMVDDLTRSITDLLARAEAAEDRCARLEEARENANEACAKWEGMYHMTLERAEKAEIVDRLGVIEDILGDDYDLDHLRDLVQADRDGRCVVLPVRGYTDKDGEQALNSAMHTCFYHNNPVTRYIADAVAEKLTREAAEEALKGEKHG